MIIIEAVQIDAPAIWVGARLVEAFHPADLAKKMIGLPAAETIALQLIRTGQEGEIFVRNDQMGIAGAGAYRAIARQDLGIRGRLGREANRLAMTAAGDFALGAHRTSTL